MGRGLIPGEVAEKVVAAQVAVLGASALLSTLCAACSLAVEAQTFCAGGFSPNQLNRPGGRPGLPLGGASPGRPGWGNLGLGWRLTRGLDTGSAVGLGGEACVELRVGASLRIPETGVDKGHPGFLGLSGAAGLHRPLAQRPQRSS